MSSKLAMLLIALASALAACGGAVSAPAEGPTQVRHVACDDGGSGGVMIDGVCL